MARGNKYYKLEDYLSRSSEAVLKLSFSEIEAILGFKLSESAYKYPAFWSNSDSHSLALAWLNTEYRTEQLSIPEQTVTFRKSSSYELRHTEAKRHQVEQKGPVMSADIAVRLIWDYFNETIKDQHGRYMSWRHCYRAFSENRNAVDERTVDYLSLHLAFYLASWGMYRGSSFLLQKDYKVHIPVVKIIQKQKYDPLFGVSAKELCKESNLALLDDIGDRIRDCYAKETPSFDGSMNNATDTLVTKILLGTLGCVPAYDRYYVRSVKKNNVSSGLYNKESVCCVAGFYCDNFDIFERLRHELSKCGIEYPPMKLMDMCFWQDAYIDDLKQR